MCVRIRITPPYPYLRAHMPIGHIWPIKRDLSSIVIKAMPNFVLLKSPFFLLQGKLVTLFNSLSPPCIINLHPNPFPQYSLSLFVCPMRVWVSIKRMKTETQKIWNETLKEQNKGLPHNQLITPPDIYYTPFLFQTTRK